jgi:D-arabinose 5-phosphate isomerase GutQ
MVLPDPPLVAAGDAVAYIAGDGAADALQTRVSYMRNKACPVISFTGPVVSKDFGRWRFERNLMKSCI